jgi:hypothetical protein
MKLFLSIFGTALIVAFALAAIILHDEREREE